MRKVLVLDTSILCVYLEVPGKATCGSTEEQWNKEKVDRLLEIEQQAGTSFVLPLATIIETGNHISQADSQRYEIAQLFAGIISEAVDGKSPWAAFTQQAELWGAEGLKQLVTELPNLAAQKVSMGDATIKAVAEYYAKIGFTVEILTGDAGLKAYQPATPPIIPRRRRNPS
jgi:hypothetical protein